VWFLCGFRSLVLRAGRSRLAPERKYRKEILTMSERPQRKSTLAWLATMDEEAFEKTRPQARSVMPVASQRGAARSVHKTRASDHVGRRVSRTLGGIHRRRNKRHG
jgi:hypothetical protein